MKIAMRVLVFTVMLAANVMSFASTNSSGPGPVPPEPTQPGLAQTTEMF